MRTYEVRGRDGQLIAAGAAETCAREMGVKLKSFYAISSAAARGKGPYRIEITGRGELTAGLLQKWEATRALFRAQAAAQYPCSGCMRRACCEFTDGWCDKWEAWYREAHRAAADAIRAGQ